MQWKNKTTVLILRPSTNKAFKLECINQIGKVAKTSHSYLIQVSHTILRLSLIFKVKFCITTCQNFEVLEGNYVIAKEHGVSPLTRKKLKTKTTTAIKYHMLLCDQVVSLKDFKTLASSNSDFHFNIKESLLIAWLLISLFIWLMHSSLNILFIQGLNIITTVLLFHCNF